MKSFQALFIEKEQENTSLHFRETNIDTLPENDVIIEVHYSGINYKDGLAVLPDGKIVSKYPFIPGIDASGVVVESKSERFQSGDKVIVTSYDFGVSYFGGYSEYIRVPAEWIVPLPAGLSLKEAMILGTAGFTAALSVDALEFSGVTPDAGKIAVSGATGGVGSLSAAILTKRNYQVVASSNKADAKEFLQKLGVSEVVSREAFQPEKIRALDKQLFAGAIDCVGGKPLAYLLTAVRYGGAVTTCGMSAGGKLDTTVFPFILRGIQLFGIDSVLCPMPKRERIWNRLATDFKLANLDELATEIPFSKLPTALHQVMNGGVTGRYLVRIK
ncbi:Putative quinone oxidoreductase YhfP [Listeria ivanovii subsp. londoniensis]|uniref:Acryloyl-CoA reductase n=2 Tax=Listeria ivanovii TaxID=1638 RepID=A0ABS1G414_LISIV|nr:acryloyl-CoA reductase [Listeria ivanovii]EFR97735.1 protein YhdH [Listeria ivanovii FSL F6-596]AIS59179.1 quinone oxidoreductase [Listeria ivanovii subsp. londoniensis]MBK1961608.1 acryloyl-CoA reductase [Listeria ivanovii subsp. londoniensis]SDW41802.1 putative quinone oxidoreductase, YhdH/YhfP family [Listeria ivanovii]VEH45178.1 Putative quinone oxidoreductase YhfP [Listeria ivanovii subsp. londoniensis]